MLPDRVKRLLTAAVDGELDQVERRALQKVLQQSEDARRLHKQLKRDAGILRDLPRQGLPPHFSCNVLQAIGASVHVTPSIIGNSPKRFTMPLWANLAAAAAVMMAVCAGTYMVIVLNEQEKAAVANGQNKKPDPELIAAPTPDVLAPPALAKGTTHDTPPVPDEPPVKPVDVAVGPKPEDPRVVEPGSSDVLFRPFIPRLDMFATVSAADLPPVFSVRDLDDAKSQAFHDSLNRNDALHLDLFCRDTTRAFDRLQAMMKARGQKLSVDAVAQERFNRKLKTHYLFFTETMTADEVAKLFHALAIEDKKEGAFEKLVVKPLSGDSQKTLSLLLGVDAKLFQPRKPTSAIDPTKPLSDGTAKDLAAALNGRKTNPAAPGSAAKPTEHSVLVLSFNPIRPNPASSKEVKQFLEQRKDCKPNAVPVLIVLRTPEG